MRHIRAVICFNGGSAGDLLKALCLLAWNQNVSVVKQSGRIDFQSTPYFMIFTENLWHRKCSVNDLDFSQVYPVENSHYYLPLYSDIAEKIYFIDYDASINSVIFNQYLSKRYQNNWNEFLKRHLDSVPIKLQNYVDSDTQNRMFEIQWMKNLKHWRSNSNLERIPFMDLLSRNRMLDLQQTITGVKNTNLDKFDRIYSTWQNNNSTLMKLVA